jgi:hypothetical protein
VLCSAMKGQKKDNVGATKKLGGYFTVILVLSNLPV